MMNVLRKYSGVLFFYMAIVGMILLVNFRFSKLSSTSVSSGVVESMIKNK